MSAPESLFSDALLEKAEDVEKALNALHLMLGKAAHPQDFGSVWCPVCKVGDLVIEASTLVRGAADRIRECQPERRAE